MAGLAATAAHDAGGGLLLDVCGNGFFAGVTGHSHGGADASTSGGTGIPIPFFFFKISSKFFEKLFICDEVGSGEAVQVSDHSGTEGDTDPSATLGDRLHSGADPASDAGLLVEVGVGQGDPHVL